MRDEHMRGGGIRVQGDSLRSCMKLTKRIRKTHWIAANASSGRVGFVFARSGDCHLDQSGRDWGYDDHRNAGNRTPGSFVIVASSTAEPPKDKRPLREARNHADGT